MKMTRHVQQLKAFLVPHFGQIEIDVREDDELTINCGGGATGEVFRMDVNMNGIDRRVG
jgi:hypothetical protein